jgi:D-Tyr-tRNAtyr deacylase
MDLRQKNYTVMSWTSSVKGFREEETKLKVRIGTIRTNTTDGVFGAMMQVDISNDVYPPFLLG